MDSSRKSAIGIRGERIQFVPLDKALHLENIVNWFNDPEVVRYTSSVFPLSRLQEEKWFDRVAESKDELHWAVHDESGRHIGVTGLMKIDWQGRRAISGTMIGEKSAWGKGYGTDIMQTRTRYAFEQMGLHRLESECFVENKGSARCLEKSGYRQIGILKKKRWREGRWQDCILWEILDEDYFSQATRRL
ncbi:GNAT family N-acetyltransferase [Candidatus Acetothermia bacterium]|nr:GNAT family N-acetyltransferase [Candidatus Acetothermia bacterium]MBI3642640.1 GNAT family N-acetyltransferase [Candidatus Acetothermia bacterium]